MLKVKSAILFSVGARVVLMVRWDLFYPFKTHLNLFISLKESHICNQEVQIDKKRVINMSEKKVLLYGPLKQDLYKKIFHP